MDLTCAAAAAGVLVLTHRKLTEETKHKDIASSIRTAGVLLWPSFLRRFLTTKEMCAPSMLLAHSYVVGFWALDSHFLHKFPMQEDSTMCSLRLDASALTSLSFGMSALIASTCRTDGKSYTRLLKFAVLGCLTLVFPTHNAPRDSMEAVVLENAQRVFLHWFVGLFIASVVLSR